MMILAFVMCVGMDLESKRIEAILNPPKEYRLYKSENKTEKVWFEPDPKHVVINDPSMVLPEGLKSSKEVTRKNGKPFLMVETKYLIKNKLKSEHMLPCYSHKGCAVVFDTYIVVNAKKDKGKEFVLKFVKDNKLELVKRDPLDPENYITIRFTKECPFVTASEIAHALEDIAGIEWVEVSIYFQIRYSL